LSGIFNVPFENVRDRAFNDSRYFIGSGALEALGWTQMVGWNDGLAKTIEWYGNVDLDKHWSNWKSVLSAHPNLI
jgi:UDP-glucose 4,6-dehydratase